MPQQGAMTICEAIDLYELDNRARGLSPATVNSTAAKLRKFVRWCAANDLVMLADLTPFDLRRYLVTLADSTGGGSLAPTTLSNRYQINLAKAVKRFLNYCVQDDLLDRSPFDKVQIPKLDRRILPAFTPEQIGQVLAACTTQRDSLICHTLLDSGLRASELLALNVGDINTEGAVRVRHGKGAKDRVTYIGAKTQKLLQRYLRQRRKPDAHAPLFTSLTTGERLTFFGLAQLMQRLRQASGVSTCTCHTFRRTFALQSLRNGMNLYVLARLMGHVDITVLKHYLDLLEDDIQGAHRKFGVIDNLRTPRR